MRWRSLTAISCQSEGKKEGGQRSSLVKTPKGGGKKERSRRELINDGEEARSRRAASKAAA